MHKEHSLYLPIQTVNEHYIVHSAQLFARTITCNRKAHSHHLEHLRIQEYNLIYVDV